MNTKKDIKQRRYPSIKVLLACRSERSEPEISWHRAGLYQEPAAFWELCRGDLISRMELAGKELQWSGFWGYFACMRMWVRLLKKEMSSFYWWWVTQRFFSCVSYVPAEGALSWWVNELSLDKAVFQMCFQVNWSAPVNLLPVVLPWSSFGMD